uniref:Glycine cleavage T protein (Aminomethyl transferase) domain protein n=1 Tax=Toxoplasma gondii TgCATBr9 TaxID=943120 RepID=A0A2T6ID43_TOXGO|nr:glycine cleavage T protein (aminomethyl transferase) domain protein [Toxoplasma gondii TgCATBr9]
MNVSYFSHSVFISSRVFVVLGFFCVFRLHSPGRRRRQEANFPGAARILAQLAQQQLLQNQTRKGPASVDALQKALAAEAEKAGLRQENRLRRKRVGLCLPAGGGSSKGVTVREEGGKNVGIVTSSCFAPSLQRTIGMAYLDLPYTLVGSR